jgi:hypothetical protein
MSTYNKMKKRRDHWKKKTVATGADLRYHKKENKRIKKERDAYRRAWRDTQKELDELKQRNTALAACDKTTTVFLALQLFVVARIGFRAISRVLGVLASQLGLAQAPCPQTIINWVTRLAIARMKEDRFGVDPDTGMQRFSQGFILLLDATIGFGQGKIMTVLALDARHYACNAGAPSLQHVSCVAVSVADTWTGESIAALLQRVIATIGRPVAYLKDGGTDLGKAVRLLQEKGLGGVSIDDLSHVVANLVKHAYRAHPMFDIFLSTCGKVSSMLKQSVLACLAPPKVSTKARFMNLHRLVKWAARVLQQSPRGRAANGSLLQKLRERLDRLPQCRAFINAFLQDVEPILECQALLKTKGLSQDSANECWPMIERIPTPSIRRGLTDWIEKQLAIASLLGLCETGMPISSDTIESLFGVAKTHGTGEIKDANRIAPRIPVLCGPLTRQDAENSLQISVDEQRGLVLTEDRFDDVGGRQPGGTGGQLGRFLLDVLEQARAEVGHRGRERFQRGEFRLHAPVWRARAPGFSGPSGRSWTRRSSASTPAGPGDTPTPSRRLRESAHSPDRPSARRRHRGRPAPRRRARAAPRTRPRACRSAVRSGRARVRHGACPAPHAGAPRHRR